MNGPPSNANQYQRSTYGSMPPANGNTMPNRRPEDWFTPPAVGGQDLWNGFLDLPYSRQPGELYPRDQMQAATMDPRMMDYMNGQRGPTPRHDPRGQRGPHHPAQMPDHIRQGSRCPQEMADYRGEGYYPQYREDGYGGYGDYADRGRMGPGRPMVQEWDDGRGRGYSYSYGYPEGAATPYDRQDARFPAEYRGPRQ